MTIYNCEFDYMFHDTAEAHVKIVDGIVETKRFTTNPLHLPWGNNPDKSITRKDIRMFFAEHCIPEHRVNLKEELAEIGVDEYDPFKICRITDGRVLGHYDWIRWRDKCTPAE